MATSSELIDRISAVLALNRSTCASIYRELRSNGLVSNEGRGRNAVAMSVCDAVSFLIAVCGAEQVQDAAAAVGRYTALVATTGRHASGLIVPAPTWRSVRKEFARLADLAAQHTFSDALAALIESYVTFEPKADVKVSLRGPYPWAAVEIRIREQKTQTEIWYSDDGDEDGPSDLAFIDETKERQRRKFVALGGDLNATSTISNMTLAALGDLLRI